MNKFNVALINMCTEVEGPYKRLCIWFQGCDRNCKNCCNVDFQKKIKKNIMTDEEIIEIVKQFIKNYAIEGITLSGGEPLLQIGLPNLLRQFKELNLGIILFTGEKYENIPIDIISYCDIIIDGEFNEKVIDNQRALIGSQNQRLIFVSDRYIKDKDWFFNPILKEEININTKFYFNGDKL